MESLFKQQFIGYLPKFSRVKIEASNKQSMEVPMDKIYAYKAGWKTDAPQLIWHKLLKQIEDKLSMKKICGI